MAWLKRLKKLSGCEVIVWSARLLALLRLVFLERLIDLNGGYDAARIQRFVEPQVLLGALDVRFEVSDVLDLEEQSSCRSTSRPSRCEEPDPHDVKS